MKLILNTLLLICLGAVLARAQNPTSFKHVILIVQENRTPDNLFQGLCTGPFGSKGCSTTDPGKYNILTSNWVNGGSAVQPQPEGLANTYDLDHSHTAFNQMCDLTGGVCKMDGAAQINCKPNTGTTCPTNPQFFFVSNASGTINPYLQLATQYGWANFMFQTNQGPSFPAHQFLFGATSAPTATDDHNGIYASENMRKTGGTGGLTVVAGCAALKKTRVLLVDQDGNENTLPASNPGAGIYPCFEHQTLGDLLDGPPGVVVPPFSWRYYAPSAGAIWTAPNAIAHICQSSGKGGDCTGQQWIDHVDVPSVTPPPPLPKNNGSVDILRDIKSCNLRNMTWVAPSCENSDHAACNDGGGPSWVASIVNEVGSATSCDGGAGYWNNTAIIVVWDDWGGWYDHEPPAILQKPGPGSYQYGFRVPLLFISAFTPPGYIDNDRHDFGSIVRFVENNFGLTEGQLTFSDARAVTDLHKFFDLTQPPRAFQTVTAAKTAAFFLNDKRKQTDPDDDN